MTEVMRQYDQYQAASPNLGTSDTNVVWDQDHGRNQGFRCDTPEWDRTLAQARRCPHPKDPGCVCVAHSKIPKFGEAAWYWSY